MFSCRFSSSLLGVVCLLFLVACGGNNADQSKSIPKTVDDRFAIQVGTRTVQIQIAAQPAEMQKGLMFRKTMGAEEGMLFIFTKPQQMGFWMQNTEIPLDIGYFDAQGELKEIYPMYPHDERSVSSRAHDLQFALEMNQGWFAQAGVRPGAQLDLKAVAAALEARGFRPADWGLR